MKVITEKGAALTEITNLFEVLKFTRLNAPSKFTAGERICIHQRIAAIYRVIDKLEQQEQEETQEKGATPHYELNPRIQKNIDEVLRWINR